jgi:hypothetical protein
VEEKRMLVLIRMVSDKRGDNLRELVAAHKGGEGIWQAVVERQREMEAGLRGKGRMLYLTRLAKKARRGDVSLFVHVTDPAPLGSFITEHLCRIPSLTGIQCIGLHQPTFWPLPRDTKDLRRFAVAVQAAPQNVCEVYAALARLEPPPTVRWSYLCYNFSAFDAALQFSMLAMDEAALAGYLARTVSSIKGVLGLEVMPIEQTKPMISYDDWKDYSQRHGLVLAWDQETMLKQFGR